MNALFRRVVVSALWTLAASLSPAPVLAHQFWLTPSRYIAVRGDTIELGAAVGTGFRGTRIRWNPERAVRLVVRSSSTADWSEIASRGEAVWARFSPTDEGGAMIAFESRFAPVELPGDEFDAYLREEGLDEALRARRGRGDARQGAPPASSIQPVRERFRRCAKTWMNGSDDSRATEPVGLPLEIVPERAPGSGTGLPVRVLANGMPEANALVKAWWSPGDGSGDWLDPEARDSTGVAWSGRTDAEGRVVIPTGDDGEWLVSVVRMEPCPDREAADWESTWASLTFERRGTPAANALGVGLGGD